MGEKMNNIAIIPARSGSKGLVNKNIRLMNDKPMLAYSIEAAIESNMFSRIMVSTDSEEYAEIAKKFGAEVPFLRDATTSGDTASSWQVVEEVLTKYKENKICFDTICLLQPTSPLRTASNIINAYNELILKKANAITSVCEVDHSPLWTTVLPNNHSLGEFRKNLKECPRQQMDTFYRINGAIYVRRIEYNDEIKILQNEEYAYIMEKNESIDIDDINDFLMAELLMKNRKNVR